MLDFRQMPCSHGTAVTSERRVHRRVRGGFDGSWERASENAIARPGRIANLSEGGCLMETASLPPPGELLHLHLDLPVIGRTSLSAQVAHYQQGDRGVGLRFVDVALVSQGSLQQAVEHLIAEEQDQ